MKRIIYTALAVTAVVGSALAFTPASNPSLRICSNVNPALGVCQAQQGTFYTDIDNGTPRQLNPTVTLYKGTIGAPCAGTSQCQLVNPQATPVFINL